MWILKWLPDWIFYVTLLAGVIGYLATYLIKYIPVPFVYMYKTPIQLGSIAAIVIGTFMSGAIYDNNAWLDRVHEMEAKVAKAEQESKEANTKIDNKTQEAKTKIVEKQVLIKQYVDREVTKYDNQCIIPKEFIKALNDAAEAPK
jgi:predicted ATP-dependent protease